MGHGGAIYTVVPPLNIGASDLTGFCNGTWFRGAGSFVGKGCIDDNSRQEYVLLVSCLNMAQDKNTDQGNDSGPDSEDHAEMFRCQQCNK